MVPSERRDRRGLTIEWLTARAGLDRLRSEWDDLWARVPDRTPFQSSAWLLPWWDAFHPGMLRVIAVREDRQLVGLVPFYDAANGAAIERRLLGAGVSDYLDLLAVPGREADVADACRDALSHDEAWTLCRLDRLRASSPLVHMAPPAGASAESAADEPCPVLALPPPCDLRAVLGSRRIRELAYYQRRAARLGTVSIEVATDATLPAMLDALFDLHEARWAEKGARGVLTRGDVRAFHRAAAPALLRAGLLRMHALSIEGRFAAVYYGLHAAACAFFYISGFDPARSSLSPGQLVLAAALERAVKDGARAFDFLGGREPYKYQWNAIDRPRLARSFSRTSRSGVPSSRGSTAP